MIDPIPRAYFAVELLADREQRLHLVHDYPEASQPGRTALALDSKVALTRVEVVLVYRDRVDPIDGALGAVLGVAIVWDAPFVQVHGEGLRAVVAGGDGQVLHLDQVVVVRVARLQCEREIDVLTRAAAAVHKMVRIDRDRTRRRRVVLDERSASRGDLTGHNLVRHAVGAADDHDEDLVRVRCVAATCPAEVDVIVERRSAERLVRRVELERHLAHCSAVSHHDRRVAGMLCEREAHVASLAHVR
eukprot:7384778-Prymnesium_polylepis.4